MNTDFAIRINAAATAAEFAAIQHAAVVAMRAGEITGREMVAVRRAARAAQGAIAAAMLRPVPTL